MSIETLLEAAKFLELQAQQQQRARGKRKRGLWGLDGRVQSVRGAKCSTLTGR